MISPPRIRSALWLLVALALAGCARNALPPAPPPISPPAAAPRPAAPPKDPLAPDLATWLSNLGSYRGRDRLPLDKVVVDVIALHNKNGGATYNFHYGDLAGQKLYAVSPFPDLGKVLPGKALPPDTLRAFINNRKSLFMDSRYNVGTWYDGTSQTYLDISVAMANKAAAVSLGKRFNQISIFDLAAMKEIPTGGTGKALKGWPPPNERVPGIGVPNYGPAPAHPLPVPAS